MKIALIKWDAEWLRVTLLAAFLIAAPQRGKAHGETLIQIAATTRQIESATNNAAHLYLQRGELYREHQDWVAAEADYARAANLNPKLVAVDICRAGMLADSGELEAAEALFDKVIARSKDEGEAFIGRARVLMKVNQPQAAVPDFQRGLELLQHPQPEYFLELAQALVGDRKVDAALLSLDAGMRKFGPIFPLQGYALDLELERQNTEAALVRLDSIIELMTRKESWLARRGDILLAAGRSEEAQKSYRAALKSIDLLPPRLQQSPSMVELQARVHAVLETFKRPAQK
ncbi:MAG: hypothetical protein H0X66_17960 [Verrucomicrobia bacterium]|nr:hypothetical protein [Verrucomicrobiota bacterium]